MKKRIIVIIALFFSFLNFNIVFANGKVGPPRFAYAANYSSNNISVYTINQTTGALTAGTKVAAGTTPTSVTTTGAIK
jgi:hypothetical protein